jgi:hypothetical protein
MIGGDYQSAIDHCISVLARGQHLQRPDLASIVAHSTVSRAVRSRRARFQDTWSNKIEMSSGSMIKQARFYSSLALHEIVTMTSSGSLAVPERCVSTKVCFPMRVVFTSCTNHN